MVETAIMFTGVNEGYQGENVAVNDSAKAAEMAKQAVNAVKRTVTGGDPNDYKVYPGVVVYHTDWGCPQGGEVVAAISTEGDARLAIKTAEALRQKLKQTTLSVGTYSDASLGTKTRGFKAEVTAPLKDVAVAWQQEAALQFNEQGIYISTGMYAKGNSTILQAEANPEFVKDLEKWETVVDKVAQKVSEKLGIKVQPQFNNAGFTYLKQQEPQLGAG